jgi:hypothetical protein
MLERGFSQGQMRAVVDQMLMEIDRAGTSIRKGMDIYLGISKEKPYKPGDVLRRPGTTAPAQGGPAIGTRKQFKQGWGVWNGTDWVPAPAQ